MRSEDIKALNDALASLEKFLEELQEGKTISEHLYLDLNNRLYEIWDIWRRVLGEGG